LYQQIPRAAILMQHRPMQRKRRKKRKKRNLMTIWALGFLIDLSLSVPVKTVI
uniref:G_PROTEIN_RECEP_F1_2 domain-containing protein n=1 Tax=Gongylonema pulchrum TaxID=637853 RepID=A0A183DCV8_9BILA